jgi:photosystem II stability/assembly factor-like uncharacterized protein
MRAPLIALALTAAVLSAQTASVDPLLYDGLRWRLLGPFRAGKANMSAGIPGNPAVYYIATAGSGVWKTADGGQQWKCVSDSVRLTSVAAVVVASSRPNTVYAGATGAAAGLYRSADAGDHWDLVAAQGHGVSSIVIDPHNADVAMAAADNGIFRSSDGGKTWQSVLTDPNIGAVWLVLDPDDAHNVYAGTRPAGGGRGGAGGGAGRGAQPVNTPATSSQVYRSTDAGLTWTKTAPDGLPGGNFGTISLAVAPGTKGLRVYDYIAQGVYRSDDGGAHWRRATDDPRLLGGGQFHDILVDPRNPDILYATQTSLYRSDDAGKTWRSYVGAPSGADFNYVWIDPTNDNYMALAVDQGAEISMDGGLTWTTWYNQATGQFYNATTDHAFPFTIYAAQQDSGTVATPIFGRGGQITYRDWYTTNGFESAKIVADPADPNYLYATGWFNSALRVNKVTGQTQTIFERNSKYRLSGGPMGFSPLDHQTFYLGTQYLLATKDHGMHWTPVSSDLTVRPDAEPQPAPEAQAGRGGAAISSIAFSSRDAKVFWAGTSNGLLQLSRDTGAHWTNVAGKEFGQGSIAAIEAGHANAGRAFVIVGAGGRGGANAGPPRIFRTDDYGVTWRPANDGLPASAPHAIREDPETANLVFAALENGVYVSFNGGDHWQSLELNLPATSCRDLAIEQNTLVLATYGRALWALDNLEPLRELTAVAAQVADSNAYLYSPAPATRMQWDTYTDTPFNPDVPSAENPPDGAVIDYYLKSPAAGPLKMEIYDSAGKLVRSYSSVGPNAPSYKVNVPDFWLAPPQLLPTTAGLHRFVWDLRYPDPGQLLYTYYGIHSDYFEYTLADHAIAHNTPWSEPQGPMVLPGRYEVRLTAGSQTLTHLIDVRLDPRLKIDMDELRAQLTLAQKLNQGMNATYDAYTQAAQALADLTARGDAAKYLADKVKAFTDANGGFGPMNRELTRLTVAVQESDTPPASEIVETYQLMCEDATAIFTKWDDLRTKELGAAGINAPQPPRMPSCR